MPDAPAQTPTPEAPSAQPTSAPPPAAGPDAGGAATPPAEAPKPEAAKAERLASKFAALARKEKALAEQARALAEQQKQVAEWQQLKQLAATDPLAFVEKHGLTYEQLTKAALKKGDPPTADDKVAELQRRVEDAEKARQAESERARLAALEAQTRAIKQQIADAVKDPEKFELIHAAADPDLIYDTMFEVHQADPNSPLLKGTTAEIITRFAEQVEAQLEEKYAALLKLKKLQKHAQPAATEQPKSEAEAPQVKKASKTLGKSFAAPTPGGEAPKRLTPQERLRRAAAVLSASENS